MRARKLVEHAARIARVEVTAKWRVPNLPYVRKLAAFFDRYAISIVIDVGANAGRFRDLPRPRQASPAAPTLGAAAGSLNQMRS